jgi:hypothetical protein
MTYVTPLELAYRTISRPSPPPQQTAATTQQAKVPSELTRADVDLILQRKRDATVDELQYILDNHRQFHLSDGQRNQISTDLTITAAAARARAERRSDDNSQFMLHKLGYAETPVGLLAHRVYYENLFKSSSAAISRPVTTSHRSANAGETCRDELVGNSKPLRCQVSRSFCSHANLFKPRRVRSRNATRAHPATHTPAHSNLSLEQAAPRPQR